MNIKDLEYFREVCDQKNISKAARVLYLTPQGLSKIIKGMEAELNMQLLTRTTSGIELTETGQYLYEKLPSFLGEYEAICNELLCIEQRRRHEIDLISAYGILRFVTPDCLSDFEQRYPDIKVLYREFPDREVERRWERGCGNVAFVVGNNQKKFPGAISLFSFPISLLVHKDHPYSNKQYATIHDLEGQPIYLESTEFNIHHLIVHECTKAGFSPNIVFATSGFSLCHKMVNDNKGISVTVDFMYDDMRQGNLVRIPFKLPKFYWEASILQRRGVEKNPDIELFCNHVKEWIDKIYSNHITR